MKIGILAKAQPPVPMPFSIPKSLTLPTEIMDQILTQILSDFFRARYEKLYSYKSIEQLQEWSYIDKHWTMSGSYWGDHALLRNLKDAMSDHPALLTRPIVRTLRTWISEHNSRESKYCLGRDLWFSRHPLPPYADSGTGMKAWARVWLPEHQELDEQLGIIEHLQSLLIQFYDEVNDNRTHLMKQLYPLYCWNGPWAGLLREAKKDRKHLLALGLLRKGNTVDRLGVAYAMSIEDLFVGSRVSKDGLRNYYRARKPLDRLGITYATPTGDLLAGSRVTKEGLRKFYRARNTVDRLRIADATSIDDQATGERVSKKGKRHYSRAKKTGHRPGIADAKSVEDLFAGSRRSKDGLCNYGRAPVCSTVASAIWAEFWVEEATVYDSTVPDWSKQYWGS